MAAYREEIHFRNITDNQLNSIGENLCYVNAISALLYPYPYCAHVHPDVSVNMESGGGTRG